MSPPEQSHSAWGLQPKIATKRNREGEGTTFRRYADSKGGDIAAAWPTRLQPGDINESGSVLRNREVWNLLLRVGTQAEQ